METQAHIEMAHGEVQEERAKELAGENTEEQFLKDLYLFMKKRDTPIERIPHLGFKQIDLFLMFKTVRDLGGYHQVTSQQLWKQVYNRLGGNPRSTSAATCTRRHYEKLLLPYECHVKGILMNALPQHQPKHFPYPGYSKDDDDGPRPAKRKLLSIPLHPSPHKLQSDPHGSVFPLPFHYPHYYHPSHVLSPYAPISSSVLTPPAPEPQFAFHPSRLNPADGIDESLVQLRRLAEEYKTSSGLGGPLNLSKKAPNQEANRSPASSFAPPLSSKNPKFLNKPSPLYSPHHAQVLKNEGCGEQDGEADVGVTPYPYPMKAREAYVIDVKATTASSSPTRDSAATQRTDEAQKPHSTKTDFTTQPKEDREGSPEVRELSLSHILPGLPSENGGKMEIQIPLSVFHSWLRLYGSSAVMNGQDEHSGQRSCFDTDILPTNLSFYRNPQPTSQAAVDLRLRPMNTPSPTPTTQTAGNHHNTSQDHFTSYRPLSTGGILKSAASRDVRPVDAQDIIKSYGPKSPHCWDAYDKETRASHVQARSNRSPLTPPQDFTTTKPYSEDAPAGGKETGPSAVLMVNSSSLLHLTTDEVMKLKKMISSSS